MEAKADSYKAIKTQDLVATVKRGDCATPIRKRAYHRAIKRDELWAVTIKCTNDLLNSLTRRFFEIDIGGAELKGISAWLPDSSK